MTTREWIIAAVSGFLGWPVVVGLLYIICLMWDYVALPICDTIRIFRLNRKWPHGITESWWALLKYRHFRGRRMPLDWDKVANYKPPVNAGS